MVSPQQKQAAVGDLRDQGLSKRKSCELVQLERKELYYENKQSEENRLITEYLKEIAYQYVRWGLPRMESVVRAKIGAKNLIHYKHRWLELQCIDWVQYYFIKSILLVWL